MSIHAPKSKQLRFALTAVLLLVLFCIFAVVATWTVDEATSRFGATSWWYLLPAFFMLVGGVLIGAATVLMFWDGSALRKYRLDPKSTPQDGQHVALSGCIRVKGDPLISPYGEQLCAGYSYRVTGERRRGGGTVDDSTHRRSQLCLAGFALAPAFIDSGARRFRINAIARAEDTLQTIKNGGDWGKRAFDEIRTRSETIPRTPEIEFRSAMASAHERIEPSTAVDCFIGQTTGTDNTINVTEDIMPIDREVTILATYSANTNSLHGKRLGGMKVFPEPLDQQLETLKNDVQKGLLVTLILLGIGIPLISLARWLP